MPHELILPDPAQAVVDAFLREADAEAPGLIEGLYLVGSVALDDFRAGSSDIDFVAVTAGRPDTTGVEVLERVHARLRERWRRPFFDGIYVTWDDLAADPTLLGPGPSTHEGRFYLDRRSERTPIAWHTLARHGVRCRGPAAADLRIWTDEAVLLAWTNENLDAYWRPRLDRGTQLFTAAGMAALTAWTCGWTVLGVSRLHYTLATGEITSKHRAGVYARATFPERWHHVIDEALRIRRGTAGRSLYRSPLSRRRDMLAFGNIVIADAHRLYDERRRNWKE